jgi:branched-subunit amino acid aminotransferase/4-amino-4-deoxychorismate lyase
MNRPIARPVVLSLIWQDGEIKPRDQFSLSVVDRALLYGLGLFETFRVERGKVVLFDEHLDRLNESARSLELSLDSNRLPTRDDVASFIDRLARQGEAIDRSASIRLNCSEDSCWMIARPLAPFRSTISLAARFDQTELIYRDDSHSGLKSFHYGRRATAYERARRDGCDDMLLFGVDGVALEASRGSTLFKFGDRWTAPPVGRGVLPGVARRFIELAGLRVAIDERSAVRQDGRSAPRWNDNFERDLHSVWWMNSVAGVSAVGEILVFDSPAAQEPSRRIKLTESKDDRKMREELNRLMYSRDDSRGDGEIG